MKRIFTHFSALAVLIILQVLVFFPVKSFSQCSSLGATAVTYESRCAATGSIKINVTGGSGNYTYELQGAVNVPPTTGDSITGLSAGLYKIIITDINTGCVFEKSGFIVDGNYNTPSFSLAANDVSCGTPNGTITVSNVTDGRAPFKYQIVSPSTSNIGDASPTGFFNNMPAGNYYVQMQDSCGGIQTRNVRIFPYNWNINAYPFTRITCDSLSGYIEVLDSKGGSSIVGAGLPGFMYGVVRSPGDTIWSSSPNITFFMAGFNAFDMLAKDACGVIKSRHFTINTASSIGPVVFSNQTCSEFTATLTNIVNYYNPNFCIYNSSNVLVACNTTGVFNNLPYGNYCIDAYNGCTNTTERICFSSASAGTISNPLNITLSNQLCSGFTATVNGGGSLASPQYCLYNSSNVQLSCNTTGVFPGLAYGSYYVQTHNTCPDTTFRNNFSATQPKPVVGAIVAISNQQCLTFTASITGQANLTNPQYCLFDNNNVQISCNSTGIFTNLPYGNYCINVKNDVCYDTTIIRCFTSVQPPLTNPLSVLISNRQCNTFDAAVNGGSGLVNPQYCLYNISNVQISCNSTGLFPGLSYGDYYVQTHNNCPDTTFNNPFTASPLVPVVNGNVSILYSTCSNFGAGVSGNNLTNPQYCLYDSSGVLIICNNTGIFDSLQFGTYCINITDACYDTTIIRCFTQNPPLVENNLSVAISDFQCTSFTATVNGGDNLLNPQYCLYDDNDVLVLCNTTGVFTNLPYGPYCVKARNECPDTTISICFDPPQPSVDSTVTTLYTTCTNFGVSLSGTNLTNPDYCLYDNNDVQISCNSTGVFDSLAFGSYCIKVHDACKDTTIIRCFSKSVSIVDNPLHVSISNKQCAAFTATLNGGSSLVNPQYCLYDNNNVQISCNTTGVFTGLVYGSYYVQTHNNCPDTTFTNNFSVAQPIPEVNTHVKISNKLCSTFKVEIEDQKNLTNPQYCLFDNNNVQVSCNTTGIFSNVNYGSYCIRIVNDACYDTTITRCFTVSPSSLNFSGHAVTNCNYGYIEFSFNFSSGTKPYTIEIYNSNNTLVRSGNFNTNTPYIDSVPASGNGNYSIIATDNCGAKDTINVNGIAPYLTHASAVTNKCPSALSQYGSGDMFVNYASNRGIVTARIIKKGNLTIDIGPSFSDAGSAIFSDLEPDTYVVRYMASWCSQFLYDTVQVTAYAFPDLSKMSAYQCDVSGFNIQTIISGGVGPFTYEIIGSTPASPTLITPPQSSPYFNVNNGVSYSLVRLRAIDGCGNGALNDASILPLVHVQSFMSPDCYGARTKMEVDSSYDAVYTWYRKDSLTATDSVIVATGHSYIIDTLLPADTGVYVARLVSGNGCIDRSVTFYIDGECHEVLPVKIKAFYTTIKKEDEIELQWTTANENELDKFIVEKQMPGGDFRGIGEVKANGVYTTDNNYSFKDLSPVVGDNIYRLKLLDNNGRYIYSWIVKAVQNGNGSKVAIYPNPASDALNIFLSKPGNGTLKISLINASGQVIAEQRVQARSNIKIDRPVNATPGVYVLKISDSQSGGISTIKIVFK